LYREIQIVFPEYHQPIIEGKSGDEYVHKTATLCILGPAQVRSKKGRWKECSFDRQYKLAHSCWISEIRANISVIMIVFGTVS